MLDIANLSIGLTVTSSVFYIASIVSVLFGAKNHEYEIQRFGYLCLGLGGVFQLTGSIISLIIS